MRSPDIITVAEILSRAFCVDYPHIRNKNLIPQDALLGMEASWNRGYFDARTARVAEVENVFVLEEGLVFNVDGVLMLDFVTQHSRQHIEDATNKVKAAIADSQYKKIETPTVLCVKPGWQNYGHWLLEILPMADLANRVLCSTHINFAVMQEISVGMKEVVDTTLRLVGIPIEQVVRVDRAPRLYSRLFVVQGLTRHGTYMSKLVFNPLQRIAKNIIPAQNPKLYVARSTKASRYFHKDEEVKTRLAAHGYTIIYPEQHSFAEQVAYFKGARTILGIAGGAMSNIAFCPPTAAVRMFFPASMPDTFFWFLAQHRGFDFKDIRLAETGTQLSHNRWDSELDLPLSLLDEVADSDSFRPGVPI